MSQNPLVSVLMTAYNREKYISEAIESVLLQSYSNFELIIVDDCSTDNTVEIARMYELKNNKVKVYVNEHNLGDYPNRNKAASYAKGVYLKYLDSDDIIYPWGLEAMVHCMEKYPEAGFGLMSYGIKQDNPFPVLSTPEESYLSFYFKNALINMGPSGAIVKKNVFDKLKGFSGKPYIGDNELWLKLAAEFSLVRMPIDLIWWRVHEGQQIKEGNKNGYYMENQYSIFIEALNKINCPLNKIDKENAIKNLENNRTRIILFNMFFKFKFSKGFILLKKSKLNCFNLWKAFRRNHYPKISE